MKQKELTRRSFLEKVLISTTIATGISGTLSSKNAQGRPISSRVKEKTIGIIGLDTSHSEIFCRMINEGELKDRGYKVIAAYPYGSKSIASALNMKQGIIDAVVKMGVQLVDSIETLLTQVDYVLLESNDGNVHLEQAKLVFKARKTVFIDKPLAGNLNDIKEMIALSKQHNTPFFTSSALRYDAHVQKVKNGSIGQVTGADVYTPAEIDNGHMDLAWYGIHGVEMLFTVMGLGCHKVRRVFRDGTDLIVGEWKDGRIGTVRGIRKGAANIAGTAFGQNGIAPLGPFTTYLPLVEQILMFFDTGIAPVSPEETLEIFTFIHAADKSKQADGSAILLQ